MPMSIACNKGFDEPGPSWVQLTFNMGKAGHQFWQLGAALSQAQLAGGSACAVPSVSGDVGACHDPEPFVSSIVGQWRPSRSHITASKAQWTHSSLYLQYAAV